MLFYALSVNFILFYDFDLEPKNLMLFKNLMPSVWSVGNKGYYIYHIVLNIHSNKMIYKSMPSNMDPKFF